MAEGEEALTLSEVLSSRSKPFTELELWALFRECALTLEYVQSQPDLYDGVTITPDTVAFDQTGSVCFLDLGIEPEAFFVPPECINGETTSKAQLFSLGMTMLYTVEHCDDKKPELSQKFNDLLSQLTADDQTLRPDLNLVISECENVLGSLSSQDICLHLSTLSQSPTPNDGNTSSSSILDLTSGLTAYIQSQTGIVSPTSPDMESRSMYKDSEIPYLDKNQNVKAVPSSEKENSDQLRTKSSSTELLNNMANYNVSNKHSSKISPGGNSPGRPSKSSFSPITHVSPDSNMNSSSVRSSIDSLVNNHSKGSPKRTVKGDYQNDCVQNGRPASIENPTSTPNSSGVEDNLLPTSPARDSRKRQGMTISDIMDKIDRYLKEAELWALCREGVIALQRKKKHLPAYLSPDTMVVRGDGSVTFKAIPEDKPLEVIFMAPELQQKGILSEKTCLYGLGITLRCGAGQKYSTSLSLQVSQRFEQLLLALLRPSPDQRPSLNDTVQMCEENDLQKPSKVTCLELYDAATADTNKSVTQSSTASPANHPHQEKDQVPHNRAHHQHHHHDDTGPPPLPASGPPHLPPTANHRGGGGGGANQVADDDVVSEEELQLEYVVEEEDLGYDIVEDARSSTDEHGLDAYEGEESYVDEPKYPDPSPSAGFRPVTDAGSAKVSPSSAFKPVKPVASLADGVRVPSAFSSPATHFKPIVLHETESTSRSDSSPRDINISDKEKEVMQKLKELEELSKGRNMENTSKDQGNPGGEKNPLESLLQQLQSQGQMPSTQSLASAIAQHLKSQAAPNQNPAADLQGSFTSAQLHQQLSAVTSAPTNLPSNPQVLPPQFINPAQVFPHPHSILEQTQSFPVQYGGSIYPGIPPVQMHLQQDPRTGMMSWVPIVPYSSPPASLQLNQSPDLYRNTSSNPSQTGYSPDAHSVHHRDFNESFTVEHSSPHRSRVHSSASSTKSSGDHVTLRHQPVTSPSEGYTSEANVLRRPKSEHLPSSNQVSPRQRSSVHGALGHDQIRQLTNESRSSPHLRHFQSSLQHLSVPRTQSSHGASAHQRGQSHREDAHDDSNDSQTSSPSPSKDSGVSGVQLPATYPYRNSDASLMDRLLSPESLQRQKVQGQVLRLVREEQGFDMLFERSEEDCAMAEYITSLANLKWETFVSAITEKYSEFYWGQELIRRLYDTINADHATGPQNSSLSQTPPLPPTRGSSYVVTESMSRDLRDRRDRRDMPRGHGRHNESRRRHTDVAILPSENHMLRHGQREVNGPLYHQQERDANGHLHHPQSRTPDKLSPESLSNQRERDRRWNDRTNRQTELGQRRTEILPNKPRINTGNNKSPRERTQSDVYSERSQSACPRFVDVRTISETSDSTDTEMREKRRRYKKRYELDRAKSSSMHNLTSSAMFSSPENRRSDSYLVDIPVNNGYMSQGDITPVNSEPEDYDNHLNHTYPQPRGYNDHTNNSTPTERNSQRPHDIHHSHSIQEKYVDSKYRPPPTRKSVSLSPTPILDYATKISSGTYDEHKYNSLPRDVFKRQTSASALDTFSHPPFSNSRQPVLDRKQEISQRRAKDRDFSNTSSSNISSKDYFPKHNSESDSETNFRENVRRTSAKLMQQSNDRRAEDNRGSYRGNVREKVSQAKQKTNQSEQRPVSTSEIIQSVKSKSSDKNSQELQVYVKSDQVVYHWAGIQLNMSAEVETFMQEIEQEEDNKAVLEQRLTAVNQQLSVQRKERKKSQKFYRNLTDSAFRNEKGVDQKSAQVMKNLSEMTKKIRFLELCKTHLQMLLTEMQGLDLSYLYSLLKVHDSQPLVLQPYTENPSLQFQTVREPHSGGEVQVLHAGDPRGLAAYLYTASALTDGYVHQFLYTYRYFLSPDQVFDFLRSRYMAACRASPPDTNIQRVMNRTVDLLRYWLEGFYSIDFDKNTSLLQKLDTFIREYVTPAEPEGGSRLRHLLQVCRHSSSHELLGDTIGGEEEEKATCFVHLETSKKKSRAELLEEWDSFRSSTKVKVTPKHRPSLPDLSMDIEKFRMSQSMMDIGAPGAFSRGRADAFSVLDYSPNNLAEQLTLMEQDLFQLTHPVHYLNSKSQGVGVALSLPGMRTPSMQRRNREPEVTSLFVTDAHFESMVARMISYNQEVSHWVAAEIVTCTSSKSQCAMLTKFIQLAELCSEIRNFSTCLAVLDGLGNLIVRQLPTWKNLSSKCVDVMEELEKLKMNIKGEQNYLMKDKDSHLCPTIPSVLYFLLHMQQLEIGNFQLANGMYKWNKLRSISKLIDHIRIFRENDYMFEPDEMLQDSIQQRIMDFSDQDLHTIASTNETNFRKITGGGLSGVFKKMKDKLSKGEK